jgi:hypothetical protein
MVPVGAGITASAARDKEYRRDRQFGVVIWGSAAAVNGNGS